MPRILILSSSLLTDRMLVHSETISALAERADVTIWATSRGQDSSRRIWDSVPADVRPFPSVRNRKDLPGSLMRSICQRSWEFELGAGTRLSKRQLTMAEKPQGRRRAFIDFAGRVSASCRLSRVLEALSGRLLRNAEMSPEAAKSLKSLKPDLMVLTGLHRFHEPQVLFEARRLGVPSMAIFTSWDNITTKQRMLAQPDAYLVWSRQMQNDLQRYFPRSKDAPTFVVGAPQFDVFFNDRYRMGREEFCVSQGLNPSLPYVLYCVGSCKVLREDLLVERLAAEVSSGTMRGTQLLLRPHPLFASSARATRVASLGESVRVQFTGDDATALELRSQDEDMVRQWVSSFLHAAVVVNFASTATVDAAIAGRPVVNVGFDPEPGRPHQAYVNEVYQRWEHYSPIAASGGVTLARDYGSLLEALRAYLRDPGMHASGRAWIVNYVCGPVDGRSGRRMAAAILQHVSPSAPQRVPEREATVQRSAEPC